MPKVLFITYDFPPPVSAGSIRIYKLAKYLARMELEIFVLCKGRGKTNEISDLERVTVIGVGDVKEFAGGLKKSNGKKSNSRENPATEGGRADGEGGPSARGR